MIKASDFTEKEKGIFNKFRLEGKVTLQKIKINKIVLGDYYRELNKKHVDLLIGNYNERAREFPVVSLRNKQFNLVSGQHRIEVARKMGEEEIECIVQSDMTENEEKETYMASDYYHLKHTQLDNFIVELDLKNPVAIKINNIVKKHGYHIVPKSEEDTDKEISCSRIRAIHALRMALRASANGKLLDKVLELISTYWIKQRNSLHQNTISGLVKFIKIAEKQDEYDEDVLKAVMKKFSPTDILEEAEYRARCVAKVLAKHCEINESKFE